jgi:hypothetical protein
MNPGSPVVAPVLDWSGALYLVPYLLAAIFPLFMGIFVRRRNHAPASGTFVAMLFAQAFWSSASVMEILAPSLAMKVFWDDLQYLAVGLVAVLALAFSYRYEGAWFKGGRRTLLLLFLFPLAAWIFAASSSLHGLHRADATIDSTIRFGELLYTFSGPMLVLLIPIYGMSVYGIARLFLHAMHSLGSRRNGALCAAAGLALPLLGTVLTISRVRIYGRLESSSLWLVVGDLLIALGLFRFRMAGILPVARQRIVENLHDPVIVISEEGYIVDHNDLRNVDRRVFRQVRQPQRQGIAFRPLGRLPGSPGRQLQGN